MKKVHFIGIGGIGVSALAKYYFEKDHQVTGSDLVSSEITDFLKKRGVKILIGKHKAKNLPKDVNLVIYSPAVQKNNPELKKAYKLKSNIQYPISNIQIKSYPEALGELTKKYFTIAVSGTHGKSTTTAMIGLTLVKAGLDPTVIIGTKLKEFGDSNCRVGESKYLVIEADEWQASFLNYFPKIIVLTNIEREHLDYYKNLKHILNTYQKYLLNLPEYGILVANDDDDNISKLKNQIPKIKVQNYSLRQKWAKKIRKVLQIPGEHNVSNALAVLTVARLLKIPDKLSFKVLSEYQGSWRRFEIKQSTISPLFPHSNQQLTIISDYAHHPTEIKATLGAAREKFPKRKIWCVFQPHQYQRTFCLFKDFVKVFRQAQDKFLIDKLIIIDIFDVAGRETPRIRKLVSSEKLVKEIKKRGKGDEVKYVSTIKKAANYLKEKLKGGEVLIIMGAGDVYKIIEYF